MTRSTILAVLVFGLAACTSAAPAAKPASSTPTAPTTAAAATSATASAAASAAAPEASCDGNCAEEPTPTTAASTSGHEFKRVTASADYPLNECVITGEELGDVASRVAFSYDGTEVQFCCPGCAKKFEKNPAPYLAKIAAAKTK